MHAETARALEVRFEFRIIGSADSGYDRQDGTTGATSQPVPLSRARTRPPPRLVVTHQHTVGQYSLVHLRGWSLLILTSRYQSLPVVTSRYQSLPDRRSIDLIGQIVSRSWVVLLGNAAHEHNRVTGTIRSRGQQGHGDNRVTGTTGSRRQ
jgi:hypothetical protein